MALVPTERAAIVAAMREVRTDGLRFAGHLRGRVYEVRAEGETSRWTQKTPPRIIELVKARNGPRSSPS